MSTAHRPTWAPAMGHDDQGGNKMFGNSRMASKLDQKDHTVMKFRKLGQGSRQELARSDLRTELETQEMKLKIDKQNKDAGFQEKRDEDLKLLTQSGHNARGIKLIPNADDADDVDEEDDDEIGGDDESDSDEDSDEDEDALLLAELEKIKAERAEAAAKAAALEQKKRQEEEEEAIIAANPLLRAQLGLGGGAGSEDFKVKRRWDEDVTFKNQAKGGGGKQEKRFINDTIRNDFHKRFINRYIR